MSQARQLETAAAACAQKASACEASAAIPDQKVSLGSAGSFTARYEWFSTALAAAKKLPDAPRAAQMRAAEQHLDADVADAQARPAAGADFSMARQRADAILAEREFATADQASLWDRFLEWVFTWLDRMLMRVAAFGGRSPWIGPLIEWGLTGLACALVLVWILRAVRKERLRLRVEAARPIEVSEERVLNWMREAETHAAQGAFRDAVHCLYWASIATLEGRRFWHPDRARTPREYLRLLDAASSVAALLRRQTLAFETIWYGLRPAQRSDYDQALRLHQELRAA
ncbi:MAG TPA: DUF4129 domain-containing protein [Acidobacteriaceae bacterium]|nr:DUF4129 domain-containing protein [Acidobacteriaceae bacterium]